MSMEGQERLIYGWNGAEWEKILVDALGHLQVDVLSVVAAASQCYGWDTAAWQRLLLEGVGLHNLRVKLYDGANGIDSASGVPHRTIERGLFTNAQVYGRSLANDAKAINTYPIDRDDIPAVYNALCTIDFLAGFDGATWDRLRTYGTGVLTVAKGAIAPTRIRMTATGRVGVAGAKALFWIACSPDGPAAEWEISDSDAGGAAIEYDHFDADKHSDHLDFNPPMEFATGIWVEKFDHMKSLVFCYR